MDLTSAMVEAASCLLCVVDVESGAIGAVNGATQRLTGATEAALLGTPVWEVLELPFRPEQLRAVQTEEPVHIPVAFDAALRPASGDPVPVVWSGSFITDPSGVRTHLMLTGIDASGEFDSGSLLSHLMRAATATALVGADLEGRVTFVSAGAEAMLGYSASELVGLTIPTEMFETPDFLEAVSQWSERHETRDWNLTRKNGSQLVASVTVSPLTDGGGNHVGFLGIGQDVTWERRRQSLLLDALEQQRLATQRLEAVDKAKDDFIRNMSHELRTPLTGIAGYAELLADGGAGRLTSAQGELLAGITRSAERLTSLVNQLIALASDEPPACGGGDVVDLRKLVQQVSSEASVQGRTEVRLSSGPAPVLGHPASLANVVRELLDNAMKCTTPDDRVRCDLWVGHRWVFLEVHDQGFGIPPEERAQLFEPFFRTTPSIERAVQGAGVGLAVVHRAVTEMGGSITVESSEDEGTTFRVRLPRAADR